MDRDVGDRSGRDEAAGRQTSYQRVESKTGKMSPRRGDSTVERLESVADSRSVGPHNYSGTGVWQWFFFLLCLAWRIRRCDER